MDILTQAIFGATTYAAVKGRSTTSRDVAWGMGLGMLPDVDVAFGIGMDTVEAMVNHRSWSHSWWFGLACAPLLAWCRLRVKKDNWSWREVLAIFAAVHTHVWLDLLTSYGTNITHPINRDLFAFNVVHVFHPVATLVLAAPWIWFKIEGKKRWGRAGRWSLMLFGLFLVWPMASKAQATHRLESSLPSGIQSFQVVPTPFNSWMWHGLADAGDSLGVATVHVGKSEAVEWHWVQNDRYALESLPASRQVDTYLGFCGDFPLVVSDSVAGTTRIYAAKFGPINYSSTPEFVRPLVVSHQNAQGHIESHPTFTGPWSNLDEWWSRLW